MTEPLLTFTDRGIYCPAGDFYIDPWRPVARAVITHGHSDHARPGMGAYLASVPALPVIRHRLGAIEAAGLPYGETTRIGDVCLSFHPAGHVPGSAQVRVERRGEVWVVSGDYKTEGDGLAEPFAPVRCHTFITECTFGLPVFRWQAQPVVMAQIAAWWAANRAAGKVSMLAAYSFGKAQRLMAGLSAAGVPDGAGPDAGAILTHGAVEDITAILRGQGYALPATTRITREVTPQTHPGALVIAPPSALGTAWANRFGLREEAFASGWMAVRGMRRRRSLGAGFALSDHADWPGLNAAIRATGAARVFATHGYTVPFRRWLEAQGYEAGIVATQYGAEAEEAGEREAGGPESGGPENRGPENRGPESGGPEVGGLGAGGLGAGGHEVGGLEDGWPQMGGPGISGSGISGSGISRPGMLQGARNGPDPQEKDPG